MSTEIIWSGYKSRLARLSIFLLSSLETPWGDQFKIEGKTIQFRMKEFMTEEAGEDQDFGCLLSPRSHECASCCCFLGLSPFVFPEIIDQEMSWRGVQTFVIGNSYSLHLGAPPTTATFLFSSSWPDDPIEAAKRALITLEEGVPNHFLRDQNYSRSYVQEEDTISSLLERFKPFLLEVK